MPYDDAKSTFGFEELEVYQVARDFRKRVYELSKLLPSDERYGLVQQMSRAAVSITSNIAEGHGRYNYKDNARFCRLARGSLAEVIDDLNVCIDESYANQDHVQELRRCADRLVKLLNGYLSYLNRQAKVP